MITPVQFRELFVSVLILLGITISGNVVANDELWSTLAEGGKVLIMRHAPVMQGRENGNSLVRDPSCQKERNLSDEGKLKAVLLGKKFKALHIPVSEVRHSPYCRTTDTARLVFGEGVPEKSLSLLEVLETDESAQQTDQLNQIIGSYSGKGNLVLISHEPNISAVSFEQAKYLDFVVFQPIGGNEFEELGIARFSD